MESINSRPLSAVHNLMDAFPGMYSLKTMGTKCRSIPIGIEVEVTWRSYFPDLWVPGFPHVDSGTLHRISEECKKRETVLIPKLQKTKECGIPRGVDRYWEFAFDPVTDVNILRNQVHILQKNGLIPAGRHSLHLTWGGIQPTTSLYFVALILEAYACDRERILSGIGKYGLHTLNNKWATKGRAGILAKKDAPEIQHGYEHAAEFRMLLMPNDLDRFTFILDRAQLLATVITTRNHELKEEWSRLMVDLRQVLFDYGLPNRNYGKPHEDPDTWNKFAEHFTSIAYSVRNLFEESPFVDYDAQIV